MNSVSDRMQNETANLVEIILFEFFRILGGEYISVNEINRDK